MFPIANHVRGNIQSQFLQNKIFAIKLFFPWTLQILNIMNIKYCKSKFKKSSDFIFFSLLGLKDLLKSYLILYITFNTVYINFRFTMLAIFLCSVHQIIHEMSDGWVEIFCHRTKSSYGATVEKDICLNCLQSRFL